MSKYWTGTGAWEGWSIVDGKLISPTGRIYGPEDIEPDKYTQSDLARLLGVTRGAIADRIRRGTLPEFDGPGYWHYNSIKNYLK